MATPSMSSLYSLPYPPMPFLTLAFIDYYAHRLPNIDEQTKYRLQVPLQQLHLRQTTNFKSALRMLLA
jgi:hypothetical protein